MGLADKISVWEDSHNMHLDFKGQELAERIMYAVIIISTIIGFAVGFSLQVFAYTLYVILGGSVLAALLILPPWPFYRRNPLKWQSPLSEKTKKEK